MGADVIALIMRRRRYVGRRRWSEARAVDPWRGHPLFPPFYAQRYRGDQS